MNTIETRDEDTGGYYTIVMRKVLEFIQIEISTNYRANYAASNNQLCIRLSFLSLFPLKHILRESE
jgi:hypothetical protein